MGERMLMVFCFCSVLSSDMQVVYDMLSRRLEIEKQDKKSDVGFMEAGLTF